MRPFAVAIVCLCGAVFQPAWLASASAPAIEPTLESALMPPEAPYHRAFTYVLSITGGDAIEYEFPDIPTDTKQVEVRRLAPARETLDDGVVRVTQRYILDPVFPGQYLLPSLTINWRKNEAEGALTALPVAFHARELTPAEQEAAAVFTGIASPDSILPPPRAATRYRLLLIGAAVVALVVILLGFRYFSRRQETPVAALPPWDTALKRLRELERRNLPAAGKIDAYYVDLSAILRYYIEDRFHIHAPEQTTPEFLDTATQRRIFSEEQQRFLAEFLRQCDCVKFALLQPGVDDMTSHFKQVRYFIKDTTPQETAETDLEQAA